MECSRGELKPYRGFTPVQTRIETPKNSKTDFSLTGPDGSVIFKGNGADSRVFVVSDSPQGVSCQRYSWNRFNGQAKGAQFRLCNATGEDQTFTVIDQNGPRSEVTLSAGEMQDFPAANPLRNNLFTLRFQDGQELRNAAKVGGCSVLHLDKRKQGKVQSFKQGWLTAPKGISD